MKRKQGKSTIRFLLAEKMKDELTKRAMSAANPNSNRGNGSTSNFGAASNNGDATSEHGSKTSRKPKSSMKRIVP